MRMWPLSYIHSIINFRNHTSSALSVRQVNNAVISNTIFRNNTAFSPYDYNSDLSNILVFRQSGGLSLTYANNRTGGYILIRNCSFSNNHAGVDLSNMPDYAQRPNQYIPRGHGGGILMDIVNTSRYEIVIEDTVFSNNSAEFSGGAVSILLYRNSSTGINTSSDYNTVLMSNVTFMDNMCNGNGGGVGVSTFEAANSNEVIVRDSRFENNQAMTAGGAFSLIIEVRVQGMGDSRCPSEIYSNYP